MAAGTLRITSDDEVLQDLLYLAQHADLLPQIAKWAAEVPIGSSFSAISKHVSENLHRPEVDVDRILSTFQNILRVQARMRSDPAQVIDSLLEQCEPYATSHEQPQSAESLKRFRESILPALSSIGPGHPLEVARKAERLFFAHQNTFNDARVITDLRAVFDQAGEKILEALVTHTLIVDYYESGFPRRIEIGVDATDLENLRTACERAQRKAIALREEMKDKAWPTKIGLEES